MARVELSGVKKAFGEVKVIHGIDCTIDDGEFIVILGTSGCGKSTLLRIVAGLERATEGDVIIGGARVNDVEPKDRNIAMVFRYLKNRTAGFEKLRLPPILKDLVMEKRGLVLIDPCWSQVEAIVRTKRGDGVRVPIVHLHEAFSCSRLDRIGEEAQDGPPAELQA